MEVYEVGSVYETTDKKRAEYLKSQGFLVTETKKGKKDEGS